MTNPIITDPSRFQIPTATELRQLRLIARLSVRDVAERGGWTANTICRWEAGHTAPSIVDCATLLEIYDEELSGQRQLSVESESVDVLKSVEDHG